MNYPIFALDLMSSFGQKLAWRLFPHDISAASFVCQLVGRVGLAIAKLHENSQIRAELCRGWEISHLLYVDWHLDFGDICGDIAFKRGHINRLAHDTSHYCDRIGNMMEVNVEVELTYLLPVRAEVAVERDLGKARGGGQVAARGGSCLPTTT